MLVTVKLRGQFSFFNLINDACAWNMILAWELAALNWDTWNHYPDCLQNQAVYFFFLKTIKHLNSVYFYTLRAAPHENFSLMFCIQTKTWVSFETRVKLLIVKDADGMESSVHPDQTAFSRAVWSWSTFLLRPIVILWYIKFSPLSRTPLIDCLNEAVLKKGHKICCYREIIKLYKTYH